MISPIVFLSTRFLKHALVVPMILLACFVPMDAQAAPLNLDAIGSAQVSGKDVSAARTQAISNALNTAVILALSELVPLENRVKSFQTINETIFPRLETYVQEYKVLAEYSEEKTYRVMVQAAIDADRLSADVSTAGARPAQTQLPRLAFFISQNSLQEPVARYGWQAEGGFQLTDAERALREQMEKDAFPAVSFQELAAYMIQQNSASGPSISSNDAVAAGRDLKADIVIIGNATVSIAPSTLGESIQTCEAEFRVQAFRVDTGESIGNFAQNQVIADKEESAGITRALNAAAALLGKDLEEQLTAAWRPAEEQPKFIELLVEGDSFMSRFVKFRQALGRIAGIGNIQIQEMRVGSANLIVEFAEGPQLLANALLLNPFDDFGLKIDATGPDMLKIQLVSADSIQKTNSP